MRRKKILRRLCLIFLLLFILMNISAYFHAYAFTHYSSTDGKKTDAGTLSTGEKIKAVLFGINNPRPQNLEVPDRSYRTIRIQSNKEIECWSINADSAKGTVVLFHGYGGNKSSMLDKAYEFLSMGYDALLVDFMGSGGSEGKQTTIGFKEARQVKSCFDYLQSEGEQQVWLYGTSMGAVAVLKAIYDYDIRPAGIIIECPFGSLYQTTCARFRTMKLPSFPMAGLLVFWGGVQNGFWAFSHKPTRYARKVNCPVLFFYGENDEKVSQKETNRIFSNLSGAKKLVIFPNTGHENYLLKNKSVWQDEVSTFLDTHN